MKKASTKNLLALGTALCSVYAAPVSAQTNADPNDIIVTARRVEERLQDVPISITVFNQEQLTNRNVVNSEDLANYTPSLSVNNNFGSSNTAFAIRGFVQDIGTQPSVGVYFADVVAPRGAANNVPIGDGAGPGMFFDLQNVQVLKGPQGTLFGRNTTGGAVLLVPQKPTDNLEGYVEAYAGNYDLRRAQAVINLPLADTFKVRFSVDRNKRDGYVKNDTGVGPSRFGDVDYSAFRLSVVADLTPDLENYIVASYLRSDTTGDVQKVIACNPTLDPVNNFIGLLACGQLQRANGRGGDFYTAQNIMPNPLTKVRQWQVINTTTWRASDNLTVKNIASYAELSQFFRTPLFGTDLQAFGPASSVYFAVNNPIPGRNTADQYTFTEELQLQGKSEDGKLDWQAGGYLELSNPTAISGNFTPGFLHCTDSNNLVCTNPLGIGSYNYTENQTRFRNMGIYAQATYRFTDKLALNAGIRHTWDSVKADAVLANYANGTLPPSTPQFCNEPTAPFPGCDVHYDRKFKAPTWLIGLDYKPNSDTLIYAKYTRGYRAGGVSPQAPAAFAVFRPEKVDTYEAGLKLSFAGSMHGTLNIAGFYNNFSDQQLQLNLLPNPGTTVSPASAILNAGKSRIYGAEVEASLTPFTGLRVDASYAYLNTRLQRVTSVASPAGSPYTVTSPGLPGDQLTLSPKHKLSVNANYTLPIPETVGLISLGATYTYTSRQQSNYDVNGLAPGATAIGTDLQPFPAASLSYLAPRNLLNLNVNWKSVAGSPIDVGLFATNVTKEKYYGFIPGLYGFLGFGTASIAPPRMYGLRVRYSFGT